MSVRDHTEEGLNRADPAAKGVPPPEKRANQADGAPFNSATETADALRQLQKKAATEKAKKEGPDVGRI
jgi:hypothetical protein